MKEDLSTLSVRFSTGVNIVNQNFPDPFCAVRAWIVSALVDNYKALAPFLYSMQSIPRMRESLVAMSTAFSVVPAPVFAYTGVLTVVLLRHKNSTMHFCTVLSYVIVGIVFSTFA